MTLTTRQRFQVGATVAAAVAAIAGGVLSHSPTGLNASPTTAQAVLAPVYKWPHTIAVDTQTGRLYRGFVNGRWSPYVGGLYYCGVATDSATNKRVLTVQVEAPLRYNTLCQEALVQWDSAETATSGRWPNP